MLVTDKFVFLHLPRTGGTFVNEIIKRFFPSAVEIGYHLPRELLPSKFSHLPILGTVRNPWEFYVSWFHYHYSDPQYSPSKNALFCSVSEDRKLDFAQTIRNALDLGVTHDKLNALIQSLPDNFDYQNRRIPNLTKELMGKIQGTGVGLYTFRFNQMFGQADDVSFCRVETLRSDLVAFFRKIGVENDELHSEVTNLDKKNTSEHRHYSTYYSPELATLVSVRDSLLLKRFGFTFDGQSQKSTAGVAA